MLSNQKRLFKIFKIFRYLHNELIEKSHSRVLSQHTYFIDIKTAGSCGDKCSKNQLLKEKR